MKSRFTSIVLILLAVILPACATTTPTASPLPTPLSSVLIPQPISPVATPLAVATAVNPQPGTGAVVGQLIDIRTGQPATKTILYLEETIEHQAPSLLYGPLSGQPRADTLPDGRFELNNVPPGEYVLALYSPLDILYYQKPEGQAILIQVKAEEVVDLARVEYFIP